MNSEKQVIRLNMQEIDGGYYTCDKCGKEVTMGSICNCETVGKKHDQGKLRFDLFPPEALEEIAKVLTYGADKYAPRNWERGIAYGRVFAATMRHLWNWWKGEKVDPESGISHLAHAACNICFLLAFEKRGMEASLDDRAKHE